MPLAARTPRSFSPVFERFLHHIRIETPPEGETAAEARARLSDKFPRAALRRMTHLGLLIGSTLDGVALGPDDSLVFASTFAETRALEDFLVSFPTPSPLLFQSSIHPGGVQQVLVGRQQPVGRLWPLAGRKHLLEDALLTSLLEPAPRVALIGGEEHGTWLVKHGMASARSFAFAAILTRDAAGAAGRLAFSPGSSAPEGEPTLEAFTTALGARRPLNWTGTAGSWALTWQ